MLCSSEHGFAEINRIVEDCPNGSCVPVKLFAPVIALIKVGIILVEVCLRVQDISLPQDFCHSHIANTLAEHLE